MDWTDVPGYDDEDDPAHEVVGRYARLSPFELRALRNRLRSLAEQAEGKQPEDVLQADDPFEGFEARIAEKHCRRLAGMCERILSWHPEAAGWSWDHIVGNTTLRAHAIAVQGALDNYPDEKEVTTILRTASAYWGYDSDEHADAMQQYRQEKEEKQSFPEVSDFEAWTETIRDGYDEGARPYRVRKQYDGAGWSGADGGREELEKLTEAILWATETGSENTDNPGFSIEINGGVQPE